MNSGGGVIGFLDAEDEGSEGPPPPPLPAEGPSPDDDGVVVVPSEVALYEPDDNYWDPHPGSQAWARIHVRAG